MANVEEMLEGIEWGFAGGYGGAKKGRTGAADMIEARLLDELMALEKVWTIVIARGRDCLADNIWWTIAGQYSLVPGIR